jgi:hypothetical protein
MFFYSNGLRSICDEWKGLSIDKKTFDERRCIQIHRKKNLGVHYLLRNGTGRIVGSIL